MFSRIKYINYPKEIRKKMIERDKTAHSGKRHGESKRKKNRGLVALVIILSIIILLLAALGFLWFRGKSSVTNTQVNLDPGTVGVEEGNPPVINDDGKTVTYKGSTYLFNPGIMSVALIGVDKENLGLDNGAVGTGGQADTIAVLAYDTATGNAKIIVIPRETMVDVNTFSAKGSYNNIKKMQICLAYAYGDGKQISCKNEITSINRLLFGISVNHYAALDLDGIAALNDAVGGVEVTCLETIERFKKGETRLLSGEDAHYYVRERDKERVDADTDRRARQKQYMEAFSAKVIDMIKKDFSVVPRLYSFAGQYCVTDLSLNDFTYLSTIVLRNGVSIADFRTVPGSYKMGKVYAEYTADTDALFELVLDTFYVKQN